MSHQVIIFFYWCIAFLGLGRQKLQGGLWGAGLGKTEHQVMRYLSSDNANDQKEMRWGQRLLLLGSYWTLGAQEQISQWQLAALTPWKINHCRQMHKKTTPHSVSHWSWWLNSHVFFLSTLQPVPRGPDVLTAVLLLWQNNTSGFVSAACGEEPQDLVPPLRTLLLLLLHGAEWAPSFWAFAVSKFQVWPLTGNSPWGIYFYSSRYKTWFMAYPLKVMELWLHKELYHQPFLVFSRHIWSPENLLTLEQHFSLICHRFWWAFLKTRISYTQCKSTSWFQNKYMSKYQRRPCKYILV